MKRLTLILTCILLSTAAFAQPRQDKEGPKNHFERIKTEKIAFFTDRLNLSAEEAQVFWPVYNEYWKASEDAHKATMKAFQATTSKKGEKISDSELESRVEAYVKTASAEQKLMETYYPKFKKILPIGKVAKLYQAEEEFRMKMIHSLGNRPQGGQGGSKPRQRQAPMEMFMGED